jgi:ribosomal protein S12 methylthiotransferase accessory factor
MRHKIVLNDAVKKVTSDQDKVLAPAETVKIFKQKMMQTGLNILEKAVRIDNGRLDIPVYISYYGPDARAVTPVRKQMGKGAAPEQAEASAVMEVAERYSFFNFYHSPENFFTDHFSNVKDQALSFDAIARSVHDIDDGAGRKIFDLLPLRWTQGYHLSQDRPVLIPFDWFYTINEFNGSCAGNCPEEALCQGICEVVERHVSALVSRDKLRVPRIRPDSVDDPVVREMLKKYAAAGISVCISDFTLDTGIPTVGVLAWDPATFPRKSEIVWTAGTTPGPLKALSRALTETAQLGGDFNTGANYLASGLPKFKTLEDADYILHPGAEIPLNALPDLSNNNIKIEIQNLLSALSQKRMDVLAVNVTHPRLDVPAYYVMIPGAHFRERAAASSLGMFCAKIAAETHPPVIALSLLEKMETILPDKYYLCFYMGTIFQAMDDPQAALEYFHKALDLNPSDQDIPSIYSYIGLCLKAMEKYDQALNALDKARSLDPDRTDVHNLMGFCHFKLKAHEKAIASFKAVLRLDPGSAIDYANIGVNYRDMGDRESAIHYFQTALAMDPSIDFARENLKKLMA